MNNPIQAALAFFTTAGFFSCLAFALLVRYPEQNKDMINAMLGVLGTIWTLQMNYFFGSSSSNRAKDDTISDMAKNPPPPTVLVATPPAPDKNATV